MRGKLMMKSAIDFVGTVGSRFLLLVAMMRSGGTADIKRSSALPEHCIAVP
jgi:hypothetical protein